MTLSRPAGERLRDRAPRFARRPAASVSDEQFDALLAHWFDDPRSSNITIAIRVETNGLTIRIRDRETVAAILQGEAERRREMREAAP
jgi:hypothetical protein